MSGYYLATTTAIEAGCDVYLETANGGYYMYAMVGETKKYINIVPNGTHINVKYEDAASCVWVYNAQYNTVTTSVSGAEYIFGARSTETFATFGGYSISEIEGACLPNFYTQPTAASKVAYDKTKLTLPTTTVGSLTLPSVGTAGSAITWASSNEAVISTTGVVVRPAAGSEDAVVTLTATIKLGEVTETKEFTITVTAETTPGTSKEVLYSFVDNFSSYNWDNNYVARQVVDSANGLTIDFTRANKQSSTITDRPVLAVNASNASTEYVTVAIADGNITAVTFDIQQWSGSKYFTSIVIEYYDAASSSWKVCSDSATAPLTGSYTTSAAVTGPLSSNIDLPEGVTQVRLAVSTTKTGNNQLGITSFKLTVK